MKVTDFIKYQAEHILRRRDWSGYNEKERLMKNLMFNKLKNKEINNGNG